MSVDAGRALYEAKKNGGALPPPTPQPPAQAPEVPDNAGAQEIADAYGVDVTLLSGDPATMVLQAHRLQQLGSKPAVPLFTRSPGQGHNQQIHPSGTKAGADLYRDRHPKGG